MARPLWGSRVLGALLILFWAALAGGSLIYNLSLLDRQATDNALARARMLFQLIETTRHWNAERGGVYALVDERTPPNPYLADGERDVVINGRPFTKVNPAYMTRQISEMVRRGAGVVFNITSLNPIRPDNQADAWEAKALRAFETGEREVLERVADDGAPSFRYMAALVTSEPCLQCHARQGYRLGDIRGGIGVTIPAAFVTRELEPHRLQTMALHAAAFTILSLLSLFFLNRLRRNWQALEGMVETRTAELQTLNAELQRIALYDQLTGLCSRTLFDERLRRALQRAERTGSMVSVTFIDLNGFKPINDTHGHQAGDFVLRTVAQRMLGVLRKVDTLARLGGDEFVVILEDVSERAHCVAAIDRMLDRIGVPIQLPNGAEITVHASAGTAFFPLDAETPEALVSSADTAMYQAKNELHHHPGGSRHVIVDSELVLVPLDR